jgi:cell division protein FtsW
MQPIISQVKSYKENLVKYLLPFIAITLIITILVVLEKDFGSTIIIASIAIALFFISNTNVYSKVNVITIGIIFFILGLIGIVIEPYRFQRLLTFLNNSGTTKQLSSGYQVHQILIAIGSGGIWGVGFTQSIQKNQYLVGNTSITDSIFAVIAEELGLIGSIAIIAIYVYLVWQIYKIALRIEDPFGKFVAAGIGTWIIVQVFVNISANIGLIPLTGITLPFISYGGSSIISILIGMGIVLSINKSEK